MTRAGFYWLPPALGVAVLCASMGDLKPMALALVLLPMLLHAGLYLGGRAPAWMTRLLLGLLVFAFCIVAAYQITLRVSPPVVGGHPVMPTGHIVLAFLISAPLTTAWRFAFLRRRMVLRDARFVALLTVPLGVAALVASVW